MEKLPRDIAEGIAAAFAQLPQKVAWRLVGQKPANLGDNTLLVDWLPSQNDLLARPKTRVFVTHGGTNGLQEAIFLLELPLFTDQPDNMSRLRAKGGAVVLDIAMLDRSVFADALTKALHDPSHRENMQKLAPRSAHETSGPGGVLDRIRHETPRGPTPADPR